MWLAAVFCGLTALYLVAVNLVVRAKWKAIAATALWLFWAGTLFLPWL